MPYFTHATILIAFLTLIMLTATNNEPLVADEIRHGTNPMPVVQWPEHQPVRAQFVHRPARHSPEWEHYRAMEKYYDDLEDHYRWRDRRLSNYYERFEGYYEDLRKGRPAIYPDVQPHHIYPRSEPYRSAMPIVAPNGTAAMPQVQPFSSPSIAAPNSTSPNNMSLKIQSPPPPTAATQSEPQSRLERSYGELLTQLSGLTTGDRWQAYLKLPVGQQAGDSHQQLEEAAARYDRISANPDYQVVSQLPAFEATRNLLHEALNSLEAGPKLAEPELTPANEPTLAEPTLAPPEELPLPASPTPVE